MRLVAKALESVRTIAVLADQVSKGLRPVFARQHAVGLSVR